MRRFVLAVILLMAVASTAAASQTGGLVTNVGENGLALSIGLSYVNKDMERSGQPKEEISERQLIVKGDYGLLPNLDIYAKLGFADLEVDDIDFEGRLDALYGIGAKFKIFQDSNSKINVLLNGEISQFSSKDNGVNANVLDYQMAFTVSNNAGNITPYGGIKFSGTEIDFDDTKYNADKNVGIFAGVEYFVNPNVFFTGEINIFDQDALYLGVGYKF